MNKIQKPETTQVTSSPANNSNIKVCILTSAHSPFDDRIFHKEAKTLAHAGYNVSLIAQHDKEEIVDGVEIIPLSRPSNRFERMTKVVWKLFRLALNKKADIYHFHEPELIPMAFILKMLGKKVVYDVHELVFYSFENKTWLKSKILKKSCQYGYLLAEKIAMKVFDNLILAEDDYENYYKKTNRKFSNYTIVRNFPVLPLIDSIPAPTPAGTEKPVIIYTGGISEIRGIGEIIQAMEIIGDKAELWLLGKWTSEEFRIHCQSLEGWKHTKYLGFFPLNEVYEHMKKAAIGASILYPIKNYLTSLPVKAYEYMACSLPMVMSDFPCWQQTFGECALFADPCSPEDIADRIMYLLDNPDTAKQLAGRGRQLIVDQYNWENESEKLLRLYDELKV